eukprot:TRINITY_DN6303_c0_g1_i1.p1 TRINITY_DN6303_c0_g1~~TRINITY_DN6303_c0_g1_i1.p1  ORF type:complete len:170 (+),score=56.34 TRINITY_DN6303_c0_g1_i1:121-630(+)
MSACMIRLSVNHDYYMNCSEALSFIDYMNNLSNASVCEDVDRSIVDEAFNCSDKIRNANTGNKCVDQIAAVDGVFGDISICYYQTYNSISDEMSDIIGFVIDCMDDYGNHSNSTYSHSGSKDDNKDFCGGSCCNWIIGVICIIVCFRCILFMVKKEKTIGQIQCTILTK